MLQNLDSVDWKKFRAEKVRETLSNLISDDDATRHEAFLYLEERFVYTEGSPIDYGPVGKILKDDLPILIIPFLIQVVRQESVKDKSGILQLLCHFSYFIHIADLQEPYKSRAENLLHAVKSHHAVYERLKHDSHFGTSWVAHDLLEELTAGR